eukprot:1563637-Rhodomonas_salina.2
MHCVTHRCRQQARRQQQHAVTQQHSDERNPTWRGTGRQRVKLSKTTRASSPTNHATILAPIHPTKRQFIHPTRATHTHTPCRWRSATRLLHLRRDRVEQRRGKGRERKRRRGRGGQMRRDEVASLS